MRPWRKRVGLIILPLFLAIQWIPVDRRNPIVDPSKSIYASQAMPPEIKAVFERSCKNCHSDDTSWPWYSYIAPVSWVVAHDVHQARKAMNLSEWDGYSPSKKEDKLEEICEQVTNGDMPDRKYALFHRKARIPPQERTAVCDWTDSARQY